MLNPRKQEDKRYVTLYLDINIVEKIDALSDKYGLSRNNTIYQLLEHALEKELSDEKL